MKVQIEFVERVTYEVDLTPAEYCHARASFPGDEEFRERVLTRGAIINSYETWESITTEDYAELEEFFERKERGV